MDKSARTLSGRNHLTVVPPSPRLVRCRSGSTPAAAATTPEKSFSRGLSSSERFTNVPRSKSTSKSRTYNYEGTINPTLVTSISSMTSNKVQDKKSRDGFGKFLQRGVSPHNSGASKKTSSAMKSPSASAWALSPGRRFLESPMGSETPVKINNDNDNDNGGDDNRRRRGGVSGGVTKVLKYFKQKKVSSMQEDEYHRFRILHNRYLQWRFINARAKVAMVNVINGAEIQLFSVWLRILMIRKMIIQKRIELQKVKHLIKLYEILNGQLWLLAEWSKMERRNEDSICRLKTKLSALSTTLPLTHSLKGDTKSIFEALTTATEVMKNIEPLITKYQTQVERVLYQVTELTTTLKQEEEYLQELLEIVQLIAPLLEKEKSIQVHLIQTRKEINTGNYNCNTALSCV